MILHELYIISLSERQIIKKYIFNKNGINVILGVAKSDSNGVGKTAMVDAIRMVLGAGTPDDFKGKRELTIRDIMLVLKVEINDKIQFWGRQIIDDDNGFIANKIMFDIKAWEPYEINKYREIIQRHIYNEMSDEILPTFQSVREYLIRDEKQGFNDLGLPQRKANQVSQVIDFLSLIPNHYEANINKLKNEKAALESEISVIKTIAKDINKLRNDKLKIESEITKMKGMLDSIDVAKKIDYDEVIYIEAKKQLRKVESLIFKNEYSKKQFEQNIDNLALKHTKMKEMLDLQNFYQQIMSYFPENLNKNYEEMNTFFDFMLNNRGDYFKSRLKALDKELEKLQEQKKILQSTISNSTKIFQNTQIVDDIHNINEQLNAEYIRLAEVKTKINKYDEITELTKASNEKGKEIFEKIGEYEEDYKTYNKIVSNIETHFANLVQIAYGEVGELTYIFNNEFKGKSTTGRIKIICQIADENSHGRLYMKINMFDLALLFNRLDNESGCTFLIHDGSYCKPNPDAKAKIIYFVDEYLKQKEFGQYFITVNKSELSIKDLKKIKEKKMVVAEFDREHEDNNRFFGFKY